MKKGKLLSIIFALFFILSTLSLADEAYIASFNILRLGAAKKDMVQTAKILKGFDIVGLVEVINRDGVEELVDELNKQSDEKWDYHISPFGVGSSKYKEYFAYVYKKDKVKFIKSEGFYKNGKSSFLREPYGATFQIGNFDFTFVLVHTIYGNNESQRKAENYKMVDVYNYFQDRDEKENDILIAGDFNLYALDESFRPLYKHADKITYAIDPAIKTTIGVKGRANSYDNFFFSQKYSQEFTGSSGALDFSGDNPKLMRVIVSDHIPVFIVVETSKDDD
ncbi:LuxR family transcriptional regulator [Fusobacterium nucleatum YWH7199]|uniref:Endonuclease/exonuclease/phosphatase family protein n=1 Tax=Fusobacterium nucleatum TaxID=851 RepID=A0A133NIV1_FUSNU|nr:MULTISPECIES: endonuclease/exonuclease/phosphatase family protein [Fusobacterium]KXA16220.1 endonuclease/exonuclease/phosphatase family protein [Fusobacterium nucleatum]MCL4576127.1 LuxR family transcriptional regulator [Fusobacterium nucleatum YWH7056]MCL4581833.1 LuxR family transcriptional regulator [Fusobacterium nucleatum YWH7199]MCL4583926.1 LuxR family transcriptional regulator [Fusobacterium nucleatum YWH7054]MCL4591447.1 LuxR family transcriptional regulator [Fusobacterium nucleatu